MKAVTNIIGIDPGLSGGICVLDPNGDIETLITTPVIKMKTKKEHDTHAMSKIFRDQIVKGRYPAIFLETVHAHPKQGVVSMFNFGKGYGMWIGIAHALLFPLYHVRPQEWKKEMLKGTDKSKGAAIIKCKEMVPDINLKRTDRSKIDHDGMAEAYLIARFGYERIFGN